MLSKSFFATVFLVFLLVAIVGGVTAETWIGEEEVSVFETFMSFNFVDFDSIKLVDNLNPFDAISFPWFSAMWTTVLWDYPIFEGTYGQLIKYALWAFFSLPIVIGLGMWAAGLARGSGI